MLNTLTISLIELIFGIGLLFWGGEIFVQGAVSFAKILKIHQLIIGLTVVSLGTSAPELFVSLNSIFQGSEELALSNVVGSNIFNILVVLGGSSIILPLKVESRLLRRDVPLLIAVSTCVWGMASGGKFTWQAGIALLVALIINTIWEIRTAREDSNTFSISENNYAKSDSKNWTIATGKICLGIALLTFGSKLLVSGASTFALFFGISETIVGLTIVSAGTSMPELVTSLVATFRGRVDLAIGNVIGSSLLNQLLVLGSCALFSGNNGLSVDQLLIKKDLPIMVISTLACMPIFWTKGKISRLEGSGLLGLYILYLLDQIIPITSPEYHNIFRSVVIFIILPMSLLIIFFKSAEYFYLSRKSNFN